MGLRRAGQRVRLTWRAVWLVLLPLLATVCPHAESVRLAVMVWLLFVTVRSLPSPSNSGVSPSLRMSEFPWVSVSDAFAS